MSDYSEKLRSPLWQKKRLRILEYAGWRCQICGIKSQTIPLHCHHAYYRKGKAPWQYPDGAIICICEPCHEKIHGKRKQIEPTKPKELRPEDRMPTEEEAKARFAAIKAMIRGIQ